MEKQINTPKNKKVDYIGHLPVFVKKGIDKNGQEYLTISFPTVFNAFLTKSNKPKE